MMRNKKASFGGGHHIFCDSLALMNKKLVFNEKCIMGMLRNAQEKGKQMRQLNYLNSAICFDPSQHGL